MNPDKYSQIAPYLEDLATLLEEMLMDDNEQAKRVRHSLQEIGKALGTEYSVDLNVIVQAFVSREAKSLPLVELGLSSNNGESPFMQSSDCSVHRYIVDGTIHAVPHDRCPKCWEYWMNKFENPACEHCGTILGGNCKLLLDADTCPHCEMGQVSMRNPVCDSCGYEVDLKMVTWG